MSHNLMEGRTSVEQEFSCNKEYNKIIQMIKQKKSLKEIEQNSIIQQSKQENISTSYLWDRQELNL